MFQLVGYPADVYLKAGGSCHFMVGCTEDHNHGSIRSSLVRIFDQIELATFTLTDAHCKIPSGYVCCFVQ